MMKKKILIVSILTVCMMVTITYASAINTNTTDAEKKESPLYRIRARQAIGERISQIFENIKTKFLGERIFLNLPILHIYLSGNYHPVPSTTSICGNCRTTEPTPKGCDHK